MKKIAVEEHCTPEGLSQIEKRLKDMDTFGIDMQVLSATLFFNDPANVSPEDAADWCRKMNDGFYKVIKENPRRFGAFAVISLRDPNLAAKEFERAVKELGFGGAMIGQEVRGEYLDEPKFSVVLETAEKLDVPIYIHPQVPAPDMIGPYLTYPVLSRSMWGFAAQTGLHGLRLIFGGIFDKHPSLKIVLGHLGESIPFQMWRIDNRWEREKERQPQSDGDTIAFNLKKKPSEYFKENFWVTTSGMFWQPALLLTHTAIGPDRILFAVDYPAEDKAMGEAVHSVENLPISDQDKEKIFHENAEKLLHIQG